jgi:NitT/TauT family transport system substrate-binding protein
MILRTFLLALLALAATSSAHAQTLTKVTFGTDWLAEAEHGGFYQALAEGLYQKHGLDVTIRMGGPQSNPAQQIAAGIVDFQLSSGSFGALSMVEQNIPVVAVAAFFQKDPQVLIAHPDGGIDSLSAMKGKPIMISAQARNGYWLFLKAKYGFSDDQIRPYAFSLAPFLRDKTAIQQGFVSSEPFEFQKASGTAAKVFLLADSGFANYSDVVMAQQKLVHDHPDTVRAFIEASIEGWASYLKNPGPGNALIRKSNSDMPQDLLDYAVKALNQYGIVDSGDAKTLGIGAMTEARWKSLFDTLAAAGVYPAAMDFHKAYTLDFVDKKYGQTP